MTSGRRRFALLGDPVDHSLSPMIHAAGFAAIGVDADYVLERVTAAGPGGQAARGDATADDVVAQAMRRYAASGGGNVTVPHKGRAARALDEATPEVRTTGACNCFWASPDGRLAGDNTDVVGIADTLERMLDGRTPRDVLILGAGGGAAAVAIAAKRLRIPQVRITNRTPSRADSLAALVRGAGVPARTEPWPAAGICDLIVNATSLGLRDRDPPPASFDRVTARLALDLVYDSDPRRDGTAWTRAAAARGIEAADGREVLLRQAAACYPRWFGREVSFEALRRGLGPIASSDDDDDD